MAKKRPVKTSDEVTFDVGSFTKKLTSAAKTAGAEVIEKALWLYYSAQKPETPAWAKATVYGALAYFVLPTDLVPDVLPVTGYTDDLGVLLAAVSTLALYIDEPVKEKTVERMKRLNLLPS